MAGGKDMGMMSGGDLVVEDEGPRSWEKWSKVREGGHCRWGW